MEFQIARLRRTTNEVRAIAIAAATELFADHGIAATSMARVAAKIGMSKQALMHHFPTKDSLRAAVFTDLEQLFIDLTPRLVQAVTAQEAPIEAVMTELNQLFSREQPWAKLIVRELLRQEGATFTPAVTSWVVGAVAALKKAQDEGLVRRDVDPEATITSLGLLIITTFATIEQTDRVVLQIEDSPERWRQRRIKDVVRIVRAALLPEAST